MKRLCFRPQQGVTNYESAFGKTAEVLYKYVFPSPTGVTNYEFIKMIDLHRHDEVSVPNRGY